MRNLYRLLAVGIVFMAFGCQKNDDGMNPEETGMDEIQVSDRFNYETTRDIELKVILPNSVDYSGTKRRIDIYSMSPADGGKKLFSSGAGENGQSLSDFRVPAYLDSLYVQSFAGGGYVPVQDNNLKEGGIIQFDYNEFYDSQAPDEAEQNKSLARTNQRSFQLESRPKSAKVVNLLGNPGFETNDFGTKPYWGSPIPADGKWYITDNLVGNTSQENDGSRTFLRINGGSNTFGGVTQLIDAEAGDVVTFSSEMRGINATSNYYHRVWLYLIPLNANGNPITFYNVLNTQPSSQWHSKTISASMPQGTASCQVLYWVWSYYGNVKIDLDNAVASGPVQDSDGDGVDDEEDDYPNDTEKAFDVFYPGENEFGSLGFEDNWPGQGDYDFNDLVIDYNYKQVLNGSNQLVEMNARYAVRAIGASFENGFGIKLGAPPSDVEQVSGMEVPGEYTTLAANGLESGQSEATIIAFENAFDILPHQGGGLGVNTNPNAPFVEPDTLNISLEMENPVNTAEVGMAPYNPFLIVDGIRGREVHLPGHEPTDLADPNFFGTGQDDSQPQNGRYYKTANNLPWAIDIPAPYQYPVEKVEINQAYNHFVEWAESDGEQYDDWYLDKQGYRSQQNIYQQP